MGVILMKFKMFLISLTIISLIIFTVFIGLTTDGFALGVSNVETSKYSIKIIEPNNSITIPSPQIKNYGHFEKNTKNFLFLPNNC